MVGRAQAEIERLVGGLVNGEAFAPPCTDENNAYFYTGRQVACGGQITTAGKTLNINII